jgi:rubrerythrin
MGKRNRDQSTFYRKTSEQFRLDLLSKNIPIEMIGEYHNAHSKIEFRCLVCSHNWNTIPANILNGNNGCPICREEQRRQSRSLGVEKFRIKLAKVTEVIEHIGEYINYNTLTKFRCVKCNETWDRTPAVALRGSKCPNCSRTSGYSTSKSGCAYIVRFPTFIKYGITNSLDSRMAKHRQRGMTEIIECRFYEDGNIPLMWENTIKKQFGGKYITKSELKDGWTETLPITLLENLRSLFPEQK